ncbi:hypothetical protein [Streptomyces sp. NPDC001816]|uniref:hypothetical protein n=1 Tax=Streptomyces sp. NPDC001816 TaxID=3364612 RepID=UPI003694B142
MGDSSSKASAGVVLSKGRTRVWVEREALHWMRGRTTVTVPGAQIRRVEVAGQSLTVALFEGVMTLRHRNEAMVAAVGAEIEAIMRDTGPAEQRKPVQRRSERVWPLRVLAGLRDRVLHGSPWWRRAFWYVVLGLPLVVWLPPEPSLGVFAWFLLPASVALLRLWVGMAGLDTRWVLWRRGITVRARYESDWSSESGSSYIVHFRTLDGQEVTEHAHMRGFRDEIRYDPQDPSRVLAPTRVAWLGETLVAFLGTGIWGVACGIPAVLWLIRLLGLLS